MADLIVGFYDTERDELLTPLEDGGRVMASALTDLTTLVVEFDTLGALAGVGRSARLTLSDGTDVYTQTDNRLPYTQFGDTRRGDLLGGMSFEPGEYEFTVELYSRLGGRGRVLETHSYSFEVVADGGAAPEAAPDEGFWTPRDTALRLEAATLLANDADADGDTLTVTGVSAARGGTVSLDGETVVFTPTAGYSGPASFSYQISDGNGNTGTANVSLTVTSWDTAPVIDPAARPQRLAVDPATLAVTALAVEDADSLFEDQDATGVTLYNDYASVELGMRFEAAEDGTIAALKYWRGSGDANDTDVRTGRLWDSSGTLLGSVVFTSEAGDTGWQTAMFDSAIEISADTTYTVSYRTDDNYVATGNFFASDYTNSSGMLSATAGMNGVYAYNSNVTYPSQSYQQTNYWVDVAFLLEDGSPIAVADSGTVLEDASVVIDVVANDTDAEDGTPDASTVEIEAADDASGQVKSVAGEGVWSVNATTGAITFSPEADYDGAVTPIAYTVADSDGLRSAPASVDVTITPVNDAPVADGASATVLQDGSVSIDVVAGDTDVEDGTPDPTSVEIVNADDASGQVLTVAGEGVWSVNATTGAITFTPAAGYSGAVTPIAYTIADSAGLRSAQATVSVSITSQSGNAVLEENLKPGTPQSYWDVAHSREIEGFTTDFSVNAGEQLDFKINVNGGAGSDYLVEIFRLGYYGGDGATKVTEWTNSSATVQPDAIYDPDLGMVDAGNWSVTDSWQTPEEATAGVYIARLQRLNGNGDPIVGAVNQIPFIVREDDRAADIVLQTSDTTWQAYNGWFGNNGEIGASLYGDLSGTVDHPTIPGSNLAYPEDRGYAVSYNRPLITRGIEGEQGGRVAGPQDYLFGADYAAIFWLEKNGYDVSYMSGVDTDRLGADYLKKYGSYVSVGHDEYWSGDQRANVEEARDDGVNLLFWSGNEVYWKTRWETSIVDGVEYRTLVCYKETLAVADPNAGPEDYYDLDPTDVWTGTWRDTRFHGNPDAGGGTTEELIAGVCSTCNCAENQLTGQLFGPDGTGEFGGALDVPGEFSQLRVWRDTSIENGGTLDIAPGIIGYEWDTVPEDENRPQGLIRLSETTIPWSQIVVDQGNSAVPGEATHSLSLYRTDSGALVFGAGTVFWSWALSDNHDSSPYEAYIENTDIQQFVVNLFADMGAQPGVADAVLASQDLVRATASGDTTAASITIDNLPDELPALSQVTITGTATDNDQNASTEDGVVAVVEISLDGGETWRVAEGTTSWSYSWSPQEQGAYDIRARAYDDSLNLPGAADEASETVTVVEPLVPDTLSLFDPHEEVTGTLTNDYSSVSLGMRFTASTDGSITELKYWRAENDANDTDVREGRLWDGNGGLLGTVTFTSGAGESGWQVAELATPVAISAGDEYVVSYRTDNNYYSVSYFFDEDYSDPYDTLTAYGGNNGVYSYGSASAFPTQSWRDSNYWVDVSFDTQSGGGAVNTPTTVARPSGTPAAIGYFTSSDSMVVAPDQAYIGRVTAIDMSGDDLSFEIVSGQGRGLFDLDAETGELSFRRAPGLLVANGASLRREFDLTVRATDEDGNTFDQDLSVTFGSTERSGPPGYRNVARELPNESFIEASDLLPEDAFIF